MSRFCIPGRMQCAPARRWGSGTLARAIVLVAAVVLTMTAPAASAAPEITATVLAKPAQAPLGQAIEVDVEIARPDTVRARPSADVELVLDPPGSADDPVVAWAEELRFDAPGSQKRTVRISVSQWFSAAGAYDLRLRAEDRELARTTLLITPSTRAMPRFQDATIDAGLGDGRQLWDFYGCNGHAAGAAWGDADGDGDPDLYAPHRNAPAQLWLNDGGHFTEGAGAAGVANLGAMGQGATFSDYDNDGDSDLYVVNDGPNRLYRNEGDGTFRDVSHRAGVADAGAGSSAAWGDFDNDGLLDLYVVNYGRCGKDGDLLASAEPDRLYRNTGDGSFEDVTAMLDVDLTAGLGFQAAWVDYDDDGRLDLYLANDDRLELGRTEPRWRNQLWRNEGERGGRWRFRNVGLDNGAGLDMYGMGVAVGDPDNDGDSDIAVSNMGPTALLENDGEGGFSERGAELGVDRPMQAARNGAVTWGLVFADVDNDGWEDLFVPGGDMHLTEFDARQLGMEWSEHMTMMEADPSVADAEPQPPAERDPLDLLGDGTPMMMEGRQHNALFLNDGGTGFLDVSAPSGSTSNGETGEARGVAVADYDRDGRLDMYVTTQRGPGRLLRNVTESAGNWLSVRAVGSKSSADGCGARVVAALADGSERTRVIQCGSSSLASGNESVAHIGLGEAGTVRKLTVHWPGGERTVRREVGGNRYVTVRQPGRAPLRMQPMEVVGLAMAGLVLGLAIWFVARSRRKAAALLLVTLVIQALHQVEHVIQVYQATILRSSLPQGLFGSVFDSEWVHLLYNLALMAGALGAWTWFGHDQRARWRAERRWGWRVFIGALLLQGWHTIEHVVRMGQHLMTGVDPAPGFLGMVIPLLWLHFAFNLVVLALLLLGSWMLGIHRQLSHGDPPEPFEPDGTDDAQVDDEDLERLLSGA